MNNDTHHEVISEMSAEELVENDIAGWGEFIRPDDYIIWIYNDDCDQAGSYWEPPRNICPIFHCKGLHEAGWWKWNCSGCITGEQIKAVFMEMFGEEFPGEDLHWATSPRCLSGYAIHLMERSKIDLQGSRKENSHEEGEEETTARIPCCS